MKKYDRYIIGLLHANTTNRISVSVNKTASEWYKVQFDHIDHIEVDHVEYLKRTVD